MPASLPTGVTLCVPTWKPGRARDLKALHESFAGALDGLTGELVLVLNGLAPEDTFVPEGARVVHFPLNRGVSVAWNAAAAHAQGTVLCFANDDVVLGPGSLRLLHTALERLPDAGVVGPVGTDWDIEAATHLRYLATDGLRPGEARECNVVSGFLFATPAEVHSAVGGFDEAFTPCGFEEVDYCTAVRRQLGRKCYVVAGVEHSHEFGISARRPWTRVRHNGKSESIGRIHRRNRRHFLEKWSAGAAR